MERDDAYRLHYDAHQLLSGEKLIDSWLASRGAGFSAAGGVLVLTDQRLLFEPLRTPKDVLLGPVAKLLGVGVAGEIVNAGINATGSLNKWSLQRSEIAAVAPDDGGSRLLVRSTSGESWEFGVYAGQRTLKGSPRNLAVRDEVIAAIGVPVLQTHWAPVSPPSPTWLAPPTPPGSSQPLPTRSTTGAETQAEMALRQRSDAMSSGHEVTVYREGDIRVYFTPDGRSHITSGPWISRPPDAVVAPNLIGDWKTDGFGPNEVISLRHDGSIAGQVQLFGLLPPLPLLRGEWWMEGNSIVNAHAEIRIPEDVKPSDEIEALMPTSFEFGDRLVLLYVGDDVVVARSSTGGETQELAMRRAP